MWRVQAGVALKPEWYRRGTVLVQSCTFGQGKQRQTIAKLALAACRRFCPAKSSQVVTAEGTQPEGLCCF